MTATTNPTRRPPSYIDLITSLAGCGAVRPGAVIQMELYHSDDCGIWGGRACGCDPEVKFVPLNPAAATPGTN